MSTPNSTFRIPGEIFPRQGSPCSIPESVVEHLLKANDVADRSGHFVCYAHDDAPVVLPWIDRLIGHGLTIHYDRGGIPCYRWFEELSSSIERCAGMIFIVSPRSIASRNCQMELQYALSIGKPVAFSRLQVLKQEPNHDRQVTATP